MIPKMLSRRTKVLLALTVLATLIVLVLFAKGRKVDCTNLLGANELPSPRGIVRAGFQSHPRLLRVQDEGDESQENFDPDSAYEHSAPDTPCLVLENRLAAIRGVAMMVVLFLSMGTAFSLVDDRRKEKRRRRHERHRRRREREETLQQQLNKEA